MACGVHPILKLKTPEHFADFSKMDARGLNEDLGAIYQEAYALKCARFVLHHYLAIAACNVLANHCPVQGRL